jgi:hypothetical protein
MAGTYKSENARHTNSFNQLRFGSASPCCALPASNKIPDVEVSNTEVVSTCKTTDACNPSFTLRRLVSLFDANAFGDSQMVSSFPMESLTGWMELPSNPMKCSLKKMEGASKKMNLPSKKTELSSYWLKHAAKKMKLSTNWIEPPSKRTALSSNTTKGTFLPLMQIFDTNKQ